MSVLDLKEELEDANGLEVEDEMKVEEKVVVQNGKEEEEGVEPQILGQLPVALAVAPRELGGRKRQTNFASTREEESRLVLWQSARFQFEETE